MVDGKFEVFFVIVFSLYDVVDVFWFMVFGKYIGKIVILIF